MIGLVSEMLCGELQKVQIELINIGSAPIQTLLIGSTTPHLFSIIDLPPIGILLVYLYSLLYHY